MIRDALRDTAIIVAVVMSSALLYSLVARAQCCTTPRCSSSTPPVIDLTSGHELVMPFNGALDLRLKDFDGDGDIDVMYFNVNVSTLQQIKFFENTCGSQCDLSVTQFTDATSRWLAPSPTDSRLDGIYEVQFADVDGDGDDDMILGRTTGKDELLLFDQGKFQAPLLLDVDEISDYACCNLNFTIRADCNCNIGTECIRCNRRFTTGLDVGDVNGDGQTDIVASYWDSRPRVYLSARQTYTAPPAFRAVVFPIPPDEVGWQYPGNGTRDIHLVDLDNDGDLDCVLARQQGIAQAGAAVVPQQRSVLVYKNVTPSTLCDDGSPGPFCFWYKLKPEIGEDVGNIQSDSLSIEPVDIDGDGHADLLQPVIVAASGKTAATRIYLNDGTGQLGTPIEHRPSGFVGDPMCDSVVASFAEAVDIDCDGDMDVVLGHHIGSTPDRIWLNTAGAGRLPTFCLAQEVSPACCGNDDTRYVHFADLDGDGDPDYCEANFDNDSTIDIPERIFRNLSTRRPCRAP